MNKTELAEAISAQAGLTKVEARRALDAILNITMQTLGQGEPISIMGFGAFSVVQQPERTGRNMRTGEPIRIKARKAVKFRAGTELSSVVGDS